MLSRGDPFIQVPSGLTSHILWEWSSGTRTGGILIIPVPARLERYFCIRAGLGGTVDTLGKAQP